MFGRSLAMEREVIKLAANNIADSRRIFQSFALTIGGKLNSKLL
jgi:hypothetical protein